MPDSEPTVFVVDDDQPLCESLAGMLESEGLRAETYNSAVAFLNNYDPRRPGCLVLDIRMRGLSGLELQARLTREPIHLPIIIITGHGDIPMAVRATKYGAMDFLEKPVAPRVLLDRIHAALQSDRHAREQRRESLETLARLQALSPRELEVLELVIEGHSSKQIASQLRIRPKTVEAHRTTMMRKMGADNAAVLVRIVVKARNPPRDAPE